MPQSRRFLCLLLVCCSWSGAWAVGQSPEPKIPVILSTDVGNEIDDQWAVTWLLLEPRLDVLGVISAHAPTLAPPAGETSWRILRQVVESHLGMSTHPPLVEGASLPLADRHTPRPSPGVTFLLERSRGFTRSAPLTVLVIGASTDMASALLLEPSLADRVRVIQMGFVDETSGKEFNIENDLHAEQVLLDSTVPLTIGPASVCRRDLAMTYAHAHDYLALHGVIGAWLWSEYKDWYYRSIKPLRVNDLSKPWYIWDDITLAYALGMAEGHAAPRPHLRDDASLGDPDPSRSVTWITRVNEDAVWKRFGKLVDEYELTHALRSEDPPRQLALDVP